jgi:adenosylhomocysteinase
MRAIGMAADVVVTEVDPLKAIEAVMDGYRVMPMEEAAKIGDFFVTVTGNINVIRKDHFAVMKDGAIICNSGHFNVEIDIPALGKMSRRRRMIREFVEEFILSDGRRINILAEGRLVNLTAAEGHPPDVMDMSFANQALSAEYMAREGKKLAKKVYPVPLAIDKEIARLKLESMGSRIDRLTKQKEKYLASWEMGT